MPDENSTEKTAVTGAETAPDDTATADNDNGNGNGTADSWGDDFDADKAKAFITKLRRSERELKRKLGELEPLAVEAEKVRRERLTDVERANADVERARAEVAAMQTRVATAEAKALAASMRFADAGVGVALLGDLGQFVVDGEVDTTRIESTLDELLVEHPYLARPDAEPKRMKENPAQGASAQVPTPDHGIREAEQRGDYQVAAQLKADQLLALRNTTQ